MNHKPDKPTWLVSQIIRDCIGRAMIWTGTAIIRLAVWIDPSFKQGRDNQTKGNTRHE